MILQGPRRGDKSDNKWRGQCKKTNFVAIFKLVQNLLKLCVATLLMCKNVPILFFLSPPPSPCPLVPVWGSKIEDLANEAIQAILLDPKERCNVFGLRKAFFKSRKLKKLMPDLIVHTEVGHLVFWHLVTVFYIILVMKKRTDPR